MMWLTVPVCAPCQLTSPSCPLPRSPGWALGVPKSHAGSGSAGGEAEGGTGRSPPGLDRAARGSQKPAARRRGEPGARWMQCEPPVLSRGGHSMGGKGSSFPAVTPPKPCPTPQSPGRLSALVGQWSSASPAACQLPFSYAYPSLHRSSTSSLTSTRRTWSTPCPWTGT